MTAFVLLGLLLIKHGVLAHLVDLGYSKCRNVQVRFWWAYLLTQCVIESAATFGILALVGRAEHWPYVVALEVLGLTVGVMAERSATIRNLLIVHVLGEFFLIATYQTALIIPTYFR